MPIKFDPKRIADCAAQFTAEAPVIRSRGGFYQFNGAYYFEVAPEHVTRKIVDWASEQKVRYLDTTSKKFKLRTYNPSIPWANNLRVYLAGTDVGVSPVWLTNETRYPAWEILPVRNGLLHIPSRKLLSHTRDFFALSVSEASYVPINKSPLEAAPAFASMLHRIWGTEKASRDFVQEILGYLLTPDPPGEELQKFFLLRGAARGGKGTLCKIIEALVGHSAVTALSAEALCQSTFALEPLIDHRIGLLGDLRINDDKAVASKLLPRVLGVAGGDKIPIARKYKSQFNARLNTRLIMESNLDLGVHDPTGALASRAIPLVFPVTFSGKEDPSVPAAILSEVDAILLWALDGWDRVDTRRRQQRARAVLNWTPFTWPIASTLEVNELRKQGSIVASFLEQNYEFSPGNETPLVRVFSSWSDFASRNGVYRRDSLWLRQEIRGVMPRVTTRDGYLSGTHQTWMVGLADKHEHGEE